MFIDRQPRKKNKKINENDHIRQQERGNSNNNQLTHYINNSSNININNNETKKTFLLFKLLPVILVVVFKFRSKTSSILMALCIRKSTCFFFLVHQSVGLPLSLPLSLYTYWVGVIGGFSKDPGKQTRIYNTFLIAQITTTKYKKTKKVFFISCFLVCLL